MLRRILNLAPEGAVAAAPAAAPAAPAPADTAAPLAGSSGEDIFAELDAMDKPAKPAAAEPAKPADKKPDDKPALEPAKPADKPLDKNEPKAIKEMREALKRKDARETELSSKIADYERKIADYDKRGKDATALLERQATLEKQLEERQAEIRALKQEASPEFKEKYDKPFNQAADFAKQIVTGLEVVTKAANGDTGTRAATWDDFAGIYHLAKSSMGKATTAAKELFGDSSQTVLNHINELHRLDYVRNQALVEEKAKAKERSESEIAESSKQREWAASTWRQINTDLAEKSPEVFQPDPKDKQRAELFTKSLALVDSRHNGTALTPIQRVTLDAQVRLRASAFPVLKYDLNKANDRIAELEAKLAELNDNDPGKTQRAGGESTNTPTKKGFADELKELKL
jgi:hypothetical protein